MSGDIDVRVLLVDQLHPNEYNPNEMESEEFAELVAEVRHLGRVPKPIVVRPNAEGFVIVDGEHGWRAAKESGLSEIPCEVVEVDDFEAMRQTYKRNQHGTHHPVKLGRMFRQMMEARELSLRAMAKDMQVSHGTVANALDYAKAADRLSNSYTDADDKAAELSVRQVRAYLSLPTDIGGVWIDSGAELKELHAALTFVTTEKEKLIATDAETGKEGFDLLAEAGLSRYVVAHSLTSASPHSFVSSARRALTIWEWRSRFLRYSSAEELDPYIHALAAQATVPVEWLEHLPCEWDAEADGLRWLITSEKWEEILRVAVAHAGKEQKGLSAMFFAGIRNALRETGRDIHDVSNPIVAEALADVQQAPECIRNAELSLNVKCQLAELQPYMFTDGDVEIDAACEVWDEAFASAIETLERRQTIEEGREDWGDLDASQIGAIALPFLAITPRDAVAQALTSLCFDLKIKKRDELFADRLKLTEAVIEHYRKVGRLRTGRFGDKQALDLLGARLSALPLPEFLLLAGASLGHGNGVSGWLDALSQEIGVEFTEETEL